MSRMSAEEYRRAMDTLSRETTMPPESAARIERQLLDAFVSREDVNVAPSSRMKSVTWFPRTGGKPVTVSWRPWVPVAAAIVLAAWVAFVWWMNRPVSVREPWAAPPKFTEKAPAPPVVDPASSHPSPVEAVTHSPSPERRPPKQSNVVTPSGFVDLPWTAGLPAFESGEIVRMDIPVASLPTYGIDISSGAGRGPVEADVLIGQDGFARAIRLVTTSSRSTQ